jgi:hypothetical protein
MLSPNLFAAEMELALYTMIIPILTRIHTMKRSR